MCLKYHNIMNCKLCIFHKLPPKAAISVICKQFISILGTTVVLFVCLVALSPKSTAMVMAGQSVHLTTLFPGQA